MYGRYVVFTDIDHTMMSNRGELGEVPSIVNRLEAAGIPVVLVTAKTIRELLNIREQLGISKWFISIVESGAAIYADPGILPFPEGVKYVGGEKLEYIILGKRINLSVLASRVENIIEELGIVCNPPLRNVWNISGEELSRITGLPVDQASLIPSREFMLVYYTSDISCKRKIRDSLLSMGYYVGLGRNFVHIGLHRGKGWAVSWLVSNLFSSKITVGLGDSEPDIDFLNLVDVAFVIPHKDGVKIRLHRGDYRIAPYPAPYGWVYSVKELLILSSGLIFG